MRVGLVQINMGLTWANPRQRGGGEPLSFGLLPYSVGLLQAYAERHATGEHEFLLPLYRRLPVGEAVGGSPAPTSPASAPMSGTNGSRSRSRPRSSWRGQRP